ncbi:MAG: ABC transporter permease [Pyrinomonadaceae bacterium]
MENLLKDLRYAFRSLVKRPGFTIVAVLTLALGIGINTTVFSLANSVFLRQLPVADPQNLVWIFSNRDNPSSYPEYLEYQQQSELFDGVLAYDWVGFNLGSNGQSERVEGTLVSGNYFDVLGVKAELGRTFLPDEDKNPGASPVAVISHNLWQRRFNSDATVVGKSLMLNGVSFTIVGVTPHDFAPLSFFYSPATASPVFVEGHEPPPGENPPFVGNNAIGPNFFRTLGVPLLSGREFTDQDREGAPRVAIVNETLGRDLFPNSNPIGQKLRVMIGQPSSWEIIGVVKDSKYRSLGEDPTPYIFLPYLQNPQPAMAVHVRTTGNPKDLAAAVRREVQAFDPNLPAFNAMSLEDNIDISLFLCPSTKSYESRSVGSAEVRVSHCRLPLPIFLRAQWNSNKH